MKTFSIHFDMLSIYVTFEQIVVIVPVNVSIPPVHSVFLKKNSVSSAINGRCRYLVMKGIFALVYFMYRYFAYSTTIFDNLHDIKSIYRYNPHF